MVYSSVSALRCIHAQTDLNIRCLHITNSGTSGSFDFNYQTEKMIYLNVLTHTDT